MKILVVDDEKVIVKGIMFNLRTEGYEVDGAYDGEQALSLVDKDEYDLLILDVMMPKLDGIQTCMRIREFSNVPIIMLTAKSEDADKIIGLECGADDYITKPFNILELKARIRALLRRSAMTASTGKRPEDESLSAGGVELNLTRRIAIRDGEEIELTVKEFDLLELLMRNPGRVFSRETLLDRVWGYEYQGDLRTVDVHVRRLREKVERNQSSPTLIMTKWGIGYYLSKD